jgi:3-oxoacyl-[acyl-carrier protein] reductase
LYYLNSGAKVVLCGRDIETLKKMGEKFPDQAAAINLDLSNDLQIYDFKTSVIEILGGIDIIINCAGVLFDGDVEKTFPQDYDYTIDVNLRAIFSMILHFKSYLTKDSSIVNVSCLYGTKPKEGCTAFVMSKAGLEMLTKYAAAELAEFGIRVNCVTSCPVDTNCQRYVGVTEKEYKDFKSRVSKRSSKITGQIIKIDGGRSLTTSGFVPWKGLRNMNARFEPDGLNPLIKAKDYWDKLTTRGKVETVYPNNDDDVDKLINNSNWATRLSEAHEKVTANYKNIDQNDEYLQDKFVKKNDKKY